VSVVPGFQYDLFVSYAHLNNQPWPWVTEFVDTLKKALESKSRNFTAWSDPKLRTGDDFNLAIANAISDSAVFLSVLSNAYGESPYCRKEVEQFRKRCHPTFGLTVGSLSRFQGIHIERDFGKEKWPPELRTTSPCPFFDDTTVLFSNPPRLDSKDPWIQGLWKVRDSIWATLEEMRQRLDKGVNVDRTYDPPSPESGQKRAIYLAEVTDDLIDRREDLRSSLAQRTDLEVSPWQLPTAPGASGLDFFSIHFFGAYPGRPHPGFDLSLPRLQLEAAIAAKPARRPLVWLARELDVAQVKDAHKQFLLSLTTRSEIEVLRTDLEDLKDDLERRMPLPAAPAAKKPANREDPIVHIWHQADDPAALALLKKYLKNCGISTFNYASSEPEKLQSRLAICDGLVVPYSSSNKSWAEDVMTNAFRMRRREERPIAFAAVELPPGNNEDFNFEHPRVVSVHAGKNGGFPEIEVFLSRLEQADA
jgi:hypothetical protein